MTAFTVVRFRAKQGFAERFESTFGSLKREMPGLLRFVLVRKDDHNFFSVAEWESFDHIVKARPVMGANLDQMRDLLESFSEELGVTDPISGTAVLDTKVQR
jgi:quinol monooxygenase YgiN